MRLYAIMLQVRYLPFLYQSRKGEFVLKRIIGFILVCIIIFSVLGVTALAADENGLMGFSTSLLRAGGGGGGGGGGGSTHHSTSSRPKTVGETVLGYVLLPFAVFSSSIIFYLQITRWSRRSKKLMKQMMKRDTAWKYENILVAVSESYYAIQNAWTNMDMTPAAQYLTPELFDEFQTQLGWMEYRNERNVLENIELLKALPVAVYDDTDNSRDYVWIYIKGRMVDYTVNTQTQQRISGKPFSESFVEFWQFTRNDDGKWILNKILQKNEIGGIPFNY